MPEFHERTAHVALTLDPHGRIASWNEGCAALFGAARDTVFGKPLAELMTEDAREVFAACMSELPLACDARDVHIERADGGSTPAEMVMVPLFGRDGLYQGCVAFFTAEPDDSDSAVVGRMPLHSVIDVLPGPFYLIRPDTTFALWNKTVEEVTGLSSDRLASASALDMFDLPDKRVIDARIREVFEREGVVVVEANVRNAHGGTTPFLMCGAKITCHGRPYLCGMGLDLSAQRAQEERLRLRERALHATSNGMVITSCCGNDNPIEYVNPAFERITGYQADEVLGHDSRFMAVPGVDEEQRAQLRQAIRERRELNVTFRNRRKNGDIFWNDLTITPVSDGRGKVTHFIGVINDVTAIKQHTAHLEHEVNHDALTGLANRTLLWDRLGQAIHMAQRNKSLVATVLIDLNGFKQINDTYGHEAGDEVLTVVARRLQASVRESDTVARLSGDEFVLVLANQPSLRYTLRMVERLRIGLSKSAMVAGSDIPIGASMGVSVYPHDGTSALELVRAADAAMYHAKSTKKDEVHFFSPDMKTTTQAKQKMEDDMRAALERDELFMLYQPKVCVRSGRIKGLESFLRWRHPELGVLLPAAFLPEAEENGMIVPFGIHVLELVCCMMQRLKRSGAAIVPVSVNVSYQEFSRQHFTEELALLLDHCQLEPHELELELREEGLNTNHYLGMEVLSQLRDLGVLRSVDAFGDGMCNLNFLQKLPVTHLKLAKSAVHQITTDARSGAVCKALIDIGHDLGVQVIAKGVETRVQMDFLRANDCDELQGLFVSEPLPEESLRDLLMAGAPA